MREWFTKSRPVRVAKNLGHRFVWKTDKDLFNPFLYFFVLQNLAIGLFFAFGSWIPAVAELKLFTILSAFLPAPFTGALWGIALILVFIGHCLEMYFRGKGIGSRIGIFATALWFYAFCIYLGDVAVMGMIGIVAPQLFFWAWYYISSKQYKRELELGYVEPVS